MPHDKRKYYFFQLLNEKGLGEILCLKFQEYWNPSLYAAYLRDTSEIIYKRKSSVSMTVLMQNLVFEKFLEFVTYMVSLMIDSQSIYLLFEPNCSLDTLIIFKEIVSSMDLPPFSKLTQLNIISRRAPKTKKKKQGKFPFYCMISQALETQIAQCIQEIDEQDKLCKEDHSDTAELMLHKTSSEHQLTKQVYDRMVSVIIAYTYYLVIR